MTKKHYQMIVNAINSSITQNVNNWSDKEKNSIFNFLNELVNNHLAIEFKEDNKNFDLSKFKNALDWDIS